MRTQRMREEKLWYISKSDKGKENKKYSHKGEKNVVLKGGGTNVKRNKMMKGNEASHI